MRQDRVLHCTHGGGYVTGSMYTHRKVYGHFAKAIGCRALILHYRLAPEHVHPAPVDDAVTAYRWLLEQKISPNHIALAGDSGGGGTRGHRAIARAPARPTDAGRNHAALALARHGGNLRELRFEPRKRCARTAGDHHRNGRHVSRRKGNRKDPFANPLLADLRGLPPIYIQVGGDETLLDDSRQLAERARARMSTSSSRSSRGCSTSTISSPASRPRRMRRSNCRWSRSRGLVPGGDLPVTRRAKRSSEGNA